MALFNQIIQFVLSISILVILHELGHFLPAKWFKTKVEKFYLFFDPWFSLAKKKIGETEYGIGWLPFGGYVKIAGMVDESMDTDQLKKPVQPWEFRAKPAWQRLIIMLGGVTVNFFLAWFIYSCLSFFNGETYHSLDKFDGGIYATEAAKKMGLKTGDKIIAIDGKATDRMENAMVNLLFANHATVIRDGKEVDIPINEEGVAEVIKANEARMYFSPRFTAVVDSVLPKSNAQIAGLQKGDQIVEVYSLGSETSKKTIKYFDELKDAFDQNKNKTIVLGVLRDGKILDLETTVSKDGTIGFSYSSKNLFEQIEKSQITQHYSLLAAIPRGFTRTIDALVMQVKQFKIIFNQKTQGYKKVSGPIGIVKMMPESINWEAFWSFTAMFSIWLAFLNLLPIPGLDGGHVIFTLWEIITGKPVPQNILEKAQTVGVILLMSLMLLIIGGDIFKLFK